LNPQLKEQDDSEENGGSSAAGAADRADTCSSKNDTCEATAPDMLITPALAAPVQHYIVANERTEERNSPSSATAPRPRWQNVHEDAYEENLTNGVHHQLLPFG
jgi:hypothetical protein